jgi:hypothetical protein
MANAIRISSAAAIAALNAVADLFDAGAGVGTIDFYTAGSGVPAYANTEITDQAMAASCDCADPAFGAAGADGVNHWADVNLASTATETSATGNASAVAFWRGKDSDGNVVLQGTVGTTGCDINLNYTTIAATSTVNITALELRLAYNAA